MAGFLGEKEVLTRERVKEILRNKEYSYLEEKVNRLEVRDDSFLLKISFLIEYHHADDRYRRKGADCDRL